MKQLEAKDLNRILKEVIQEAKAINIPISKNINEGIKINQRAKKRFGCCKMEKKAFNKRFTIEVGSALLLCEREQVKEIIFHEVIHTCPGCLNHGYKWKGYVLLVNKIFDYNIKSRTSYESLGIKEPKSKYIVTCSNCNKKIKRQRKSNLVKRPDLYRCSCGGRLNVKEV